jgi:hypothetical protein
MTICAMVIIVTMITIVAIITIAQMVLTTVFMSYILLALC